MSPHKRKPNSPATESTVYHLGPQHVGLTLAAALRELRPGTSWNQAKQWIARRQVQVNGNLCLDEARRVGDKEVVKLFRKPLPKPVEIHDLKLTYWDAHLLVVEKPAGVTSVRHVAERKLSTRRRQLQPTLEELLPPVLAKIQRLRWPPLPPKGMNRGKRNQRAAVKKSQPIHNAKKLPAELLVLPVHRLDRDTSGLMLFARTREAEQKLAAMFRRHTIDREYVGVCLGKVEPQTIETHLIRDRGDGHRGSLTVGADPSSHPDAKRAVTHVLQAEHFRVHDQDYSIIRCKLETGRTHQIRIHLSEIGHPLCGEKIYLRRADGHNMADPSGALRHALHSDRLSFTHPLTGQHLNLEMPLPRDISQWLRKLRSQQDSSV